VAAKRASAAAPQSINDFIERSPIFTRLTGIAPAAGLIVIISQSALTESSHYHFPYERQANCGFFMLHRKIHRDSKILIIESALGVWQTFGMNLKQLAQHLNLSQTTVSRALNGYPEVNAETRQRVNEAARRFNYRPNPHAMRLATGRSHAIGHVLPSDRTLMIDPHFSDFIAGAGEHYSANGYDVLFNVGGPEDERSVYRRYAQSGAVDGVVVMGPRLDDWRIDLLTEIGLPFIVHGRAGDREDGYAWLDIDNRGAFQRATQLLTDLGHRRIALLNGLEIMTFATHRRQGYEAALSALGIIADPRIMSSDQMTEENGYRRTRDLLALDQPPTALLCSSMLFVSGALRAIHEAGLRAGSDISIIAHDDGLPFLNAEGLSPPLTTLTSSIRAAGTRVAELLLNMISQPDKPPPQELWRIDLIVRGSTGPVRLHHAAA
jgi:LacI family transcriptional regulator